MPHNPYAQPLDATQPGWWKGAVVYQVYPRSFADSDGDGIGDLPGIISKLDYLAALGVDVLWVSPFYPSPMKDNGYDISDYQGVEPIFGTLNDVDQLIAGLHERGMKLMIDLVLNHSSDAHPWFVESRSSKDNPKRDWYWWRPARDGHEPGQPGAEPTNWLGFFSEPAWTLDEKTQEYYLHLFAGGQPDLNWENPAVREEIHRMLAWWLDRGVDGFRMDVINLVSKKLPLADGPAIAGTAYGDGSASYVCGPRIHEYMHEFHDKVLAGRGRELITVGEMPGVNTDDAQRFSDPAAEELNMVFQFEHMGVDYGPGGRYDPKDMDLVALKQVLGRWQTALEQTGWNSLYWDNHDQPRAVSRFGDDSEIYRELSAKTLGTVLHMMRGTPYVYQGEELGMTNFPFAALSQFNDIETVNWAGIGAGRELPLERQLEVLRKQSRDNARTPMQWDDSPNAGFTTGTPWLPVNPNHTEINVEAQVHDPHSVFAHYQALIRLRHEHPVIVDGDFTMLLPDDARVFAYTRRLADEELLVVANFTTEELTGLDLPDGYEEAELLLGNYADGTGNRSVDSLRPWESRIHRRTV